MIGQQAHIAMNHSHLGHKMWMNIGARWAQFSVADGLHNTKMSTWTNEGWCFGNTAPNRLGHVASKPKVSSKWFGGLLAARVGH